MTENNREPSRVSSKESKGKLSSALDIFLDTYDRLSDFQDPLPEGLSAQADIIFDIYKTELSKIVLLATSEYYLDSLENWEVTKDQEGEVPFKDSQENIFTILSRIQEHILRKTLNEETNKLFKKVLSSDRSYWKGLISSILIDIENNKVDSTNLESIVEEMINEYK